jgi:hypothetical protein
MRHYSGLLLPVVWTGLMVGLSNPAAASPLMQVTESSIAGFGWQYDFVAFNNFPLTSTLDLFDVAFNFQSLGTTLLLPSGWDESVNGPTVETFSTNPGPPPFGTDVPPGASVGDFIFAFSERLSTVQFTSTFIDNTSGETTSVAGSVTVVTTPEPNSLSFLILGFVLAVSRYGHPRLIRRHRITGHLRRRL